MINKIKLYINTIKYLKPLQIFYRPIKIVKRLLYNKGLLKIKTTNKFCINDSCSYLIPELDFDEEYLSRFELEDVLNDEFTL